MPTSHHSSLHQPSLPSPPLLSYPITLHAQVDGQLPAADVFPTSTAAVPPPASPPTVPQPLSHTSPSPSRQPTAPATATTGATATPPPPTAPGNYAAAAAVGATVATPPAASASTLCVQPASAAERALVQELAAAYGLECFVEGQKKLVGWRRKRGRRRRGVRVGRGSKPERRDRLSLGNAPIAGEEEVWKGVGGSCPFSLCSKEFSTLTLHLTLSLYLSTLSSRSSAAAVPAPRASPPSRCWPTACHRPSAMSMSSIRDVPCASRASAKTSRHGPARCPHHMRSAPHPDVASSHTSQVPLT